MYALIDEDKVYCIENLLDHKSFFRHITILLGNTQCTIGLGCYDPHLSLKSWLEAQQTDDVPSQFDSRPQYEKMRSTSPHASVSYFVATENRLRELSVFATTIDEPELLCNHLIGFSGKKAMFSFHDAFSGGVLLVSSSIPVENLTAFSAILEVRCKLKRNPQWRPGRELDGPGLES